MTDDAAHPSDLAELTTAIVSAYVANNHVFAADMPRLLRSEHDALSTLGQPAAPQAPSVEPLKPAVPVKKSITDDFIISLEDGRKMKSMKRYLAGLGMTPAEYRTKWGLPADYPMVAPSYAKQRSELARTMGLGRKASAEVVEAAPEPEGEEAPAPAPKRSRKPKAA